MVHVTFIHPDLGIGGAERAVIDAALALKSRDHTVNFVTAHHDRSHAFQETTDGSLDIVAVGDWLPRSILGRCYALCAYIRMLYAAIYLVYLSDLKPDIIFCDQISACIPILRRSKAKVIFYCHFPDMLLTQRKSFLKKIYRMPIDRLEEWTTGQAHCVLVNSKFTAGIFRDTFYSLQHIEPEVLYPIPDFSALMKPLDPQSLDLLPPRKDTIFLSINRYERKKNLRLAITALGKLQEKIKSLEKVHLIMAGGYDERVVENRQHYLELRELAEKLQLSKHITFLRSFSDSEKRTLLHHSSCLLYTPDMEHFGIVPIEAMFLKCPVIAVSSGGPLETVADKETGFLCKPDADNFATLMHEFVKDARLSDIMGRAGHDRVVNMFSHETFTNQLDKIVLDLHSK